MFIICLSCFNINVSYFSYQIQRCFGSSHQLYWRKTNVTLTQSTTEAKQRLPSSELCARSGPWTPEISGRWTGERWRKAFRRKNKRKMKEDEGRKKWKFEVELLMFQIEQLNTLGIVLDPLENHDITVWVKWVKSHCGLVSAEPWIFVPICSACDSIHRFRPRNRNDQRLHNCRGHP